VLLTAVITFSNVIAVYMLHTSHCNKSVHIYSESLNLNTAVVAMTANTSKRDPELKIQESVESIDDAIAVATANLGLLPGVAFQARVLFNFSFNFSQNS